MGVPTEAVFASRKRLPKDGFRSVSSRFPGRKNEKAGSEAGFEPQAVLLERQC